MCPGRTPSAPTRPIRVWFFVGARHALPLRKHDRFVGQNGTALLTVLVLVVLLGLAAGMAGQSLGALLQREREAELLWRGQQYRQALASYYGFRQGAQGAFPSKLEDLLRDPRSPAVIRHLRRLYNDPMTGKEWELIKDQGGRISGVRSTSELAPFQQTGFPGGLEEFEGKSSYREWEFVFVPAKKAQTQVQGSKQKAPGTPKPPAHNP